MRDQLFPDIRRAASLYAADDLDRLAPAVARLRFGERVPELAHLDPVYQLGRAIDLFHLPFVDLRARTLATHELVEALVSAERDHPAAFRQLLESFTTDLRFPDHRRQIVETAIDALDQVDALLPGLAWEHITIEPPPEPSDFRIVRDDFDELRARYVDEAGMAETRILAPVLERIEHAEGKIVLIGDPCQLPAVGAGGLFTGIVERHGVIELGENRRQRDLEECRALEAIRNGLGRDYLAFAEGKGRLISSDSPVRAKVRLLSDWWEAARDDLPGNIMIALRWRDVAELNALARALMDSHGQLGRQRLTVAEAEYAPGDRIVCLRNSDVLGVKNGTRATVVAVDRKHGTMTVVTDRGDRVELGGRYLGDGHVRHAYALTGHVGQGVTVERAFVLGIGGQRLREWGYVALSRARHETRLYVTATPRERESHFHDLDDRDPVTRLGQALEESAIERLGVDQRPLPSGPLHDTRAEIEQFSPTAELRARLRLLEQERLALTQARRRAEKSLREAERELDQLGPLRRRRHRDRLLTEMECAHAAARVADERLMTLAAESRNLRGASRRLEAPATSGPDPAAMRLQRELDGPVIEL